jgi:hypothetical protein
MNRPNETFAAIVSTKDVHPGVITFAHEQFRLLTTDEQRDALLSRLRVGDQSDDQAAWERIVHLAGEWARLTHRAKHSQAERKLQIERHRKIAKYLRKAYGLIREGQNADREAERLTQEWSDSCRAYCRNNGITVSAKAIDAHGDVLGNMLQASFRLLIESADSVSVPEAPWDGRGIPKPVLRGLGELYEDATGLKATTGGGSFFQFVKAFLETLGLTVYRPEYEEGDISYEALMSAIKRALHESRAKSRSL